jgi:uncharacterized OB-fold protein
MMGFERLGVRPAVTPETAPFWAAANLGKLMVEQCDNCGLHVFPPRGICRRCFSRSLTWVEVLAPATVHSYTLNQNAWTPDVPAEYGLVLAEFPAFSGVRFVGLTDGFDESPPIGSLVGFEFRRAFGDVCRVVFVPWRAA